MVDHVHIMLSISPKYSVAQVIEYRWTASTGVAMFPDAASTADELIQAADIAMYQVKVNGRDGIRLARAGFREDVSA